jgi:hypothetical protein
MSAKQLTLDAAEVEALACARCGAVLAYRPALNGAGR